MAEKKLRRCTGSSLNLREEMKQNYVIVHDVSSNVSFEKYIQFARGSFDQAVKLYNKKDYQRAYVDFTKFHQFIKEKLPAHQGYDHGRSENAKIWLLQADEACVEFLEEISFQLDIIEDEKNHPNSRNILLIEMQKHKVDIFVPEWIDQDSDDEGPVMQRNAPFNNNHNRNDHHTDHHFNHHSELSRAAFPNQHFTPPQFQHSHSLPPQHHQPLQPHHPQPHRQSSENYSHHSHTESQDLAQAIEESLQTCSLKSSTTHTSHGSAQSPFVEQYHSTHGTNSPYDVGHTFTRHAPVEQPHSHSVPHSHSASPTPHYSGEHHSHSPVPHYNDPYAQQHFSSGHAQHHSSDARTSYSQGGRAGSVAKFVLPGLTQDDASILRHYKSYTTFDIPAPTIASHSISIGRHAFAFQQHDFHLSFAPFLRSLPAELHMSRAAVEVNRCFFIHLGVATQVHPFALQAYFRHTAAAEKSIEEDWEQELARTISQYSGCVDANVLQYTWPANFDKYRIMLVSGPASDPLLTVFVPTQRTRPVEDLYEVVIRNDRDHYTLLRPLANLTTKIKIIDQLVAEARQQHLVCQVCEVTSKPHRSVGAVLDRL